jgi:hypothetical protein
MDARFPSSPSRGAAFVRLNLQSRTYDSSLQSRNSVRWVSRLYVGLFLTFLYDHAVFTILPSGASTSSGTIATHRPVSTHGLALAVIIGGIALGIWAFWLLVVRTRKLKLKANVASAEASESSPLLAVQYQAPMNLQVRSSMIFPRT